MVPIDANCLAVRTEWVKSDVEALPITDVLCIARIIYALVNRGDFLVDKLCNYLTQKIRNKMPEVNDERAEVINYGLHLVLGEIPKNFILLFIAYFFGIFKLTLVALIIMMPYRGASGGFHLKTHLGCMAATATFYIGNVFLSKVVVWESLYIKCLMILAVGIFSMFMIRAYAPADTEYVPILRKKDRRVKKILSYITMTITLLASLFIQYNTIANLCIFGVLIQTVSITKFTYKLAKCKYGYVAQWI